MRAKIAYSAVLLVLLACVSCGGGKLTTEEATKILKPQIDNAGTIYGLTPHFGEVTGITHNDTGSEAVVTYTIRWDRPGQEPAVTPKTATFRKFDDGSWRVRGN